MLFHYSDPICETDPHALPNLEVWEVDSRWDCVQEPDFKGLGWYYTFCFPGCIADSEPIGPFKTEAEALADARGQ